MYSRQLLILSFSAPAILTLASCQTSNLADVISAKVLTANRLGITHNRIEKFWNLHGSVPTKPDELPDEKWRDCSMKDGWGRELNWESDGKRKVRVWSLGRDGRPGGTGDDVDMEVIFLAEQKEQHDYPTIKTSDGSGPFTDP